MNYLLSKQQTYDLESNILSKNNISIDELMFEAGTALWYQFLKRYGSLPKHVCVFIGSGNNAGDALVFVIHALNAGVSVEIIQVLPPKSKSLIKLIKDYPALTECFVDKPTHKSFDVILDGLFGIGFNQKVDDQITHFFNVFNDLKGYKVAVDIPSGIDTDSGYAQHHCQVDLTITFFSYKIGQFFSVGKSAQTEICVVLKHYYDEDFGDLVVNSKVFLDKSLHMHKYEYGNVAVIGGSTGMEGAGLLSSLAALKSGAGLSKYYYLSDLNINNEPSIISETYNKELIEYLTSKQSVCVIGPGLTKKDAKIVVGDFMNKDVHLIIDAGALHVLPKVYDFNNRCILTPHIGEAAKLLDVSNEYILTNPIEAAITLNKNYHTPIVLKAASTIVVFDGKISYITNGDPSLATAGSGDVLAGMIAGFVARYGFSRKAIEQAIFRHAELGSLWSKSNLSNLIASDLLKD